MLRPKIIDPDVEDEISKMAQGEDEGEVLLPQSKPCTTSIKVHSVDLASVIKYETTHKNKKVKEHEIGKENAEGKSDRNSTGRKRSTPVSRKERKRWYDTIW